MTKSSNIFQGQNQPEKRDARSRSPPPTHNPRRCHLNHELVPAEENLNRIDSFSDDPVQPSVGATLPGTSRRKQAAVRPFVGAAAAVGPGYHRALEGRRQALCEPLAGQCRTAAALPAGESRRIICRSGTLRFTGAGAGTAKRKGPAVLPQSASAQGTQRAVTTRRNSRPNLSEKRTGS